MSQQRLLITKNITEKTPGLCVRKGTGFFIFRQQKEYLMKTRQTLVCGLVAAALLLTFTACKQDPDPPAPLTTPPPFYETVHVAGGTFTMGSPTTETNRGSDETQWDVALTGFYMGKYLVTQKQWYEVMGTTIQELQTAAAPTDTTDYGREGDYPVYWVSWYDALVFCNKLSVKEGLTPAYSISGKTNPAEWGAVPTSSDATWNAAVMVTGSTGWRLPTEAQWEYAARGGQSANGYKIYSGSDTIDDVAWYSGNNGASGTDTYGTKQVGKKAANELGIYDMSGNVFEWCWDWYGPYPATTTPPATDPSGISSGSNRVWRGSDWGDAAQYARSAYRDSAVPSYRSQYLGFRLLRP
jgi:formylglycine-generating enzyme required for sulfatase activity